MSKRSSTSGDSANPKRIRKPAGFRFARTDRDVSQSQSEPSNSSVFVTVSNPDERRTALRAKTRILESVDEAARITSNDIDTAPIMEQSAEEATIDIPDDPESSSFMDADPPIEIKRKRERFTRNADRLNEWLKFRSIFLDEALRHDGLGDFFRYKTCSGCNEDNVACIKCIDCPSGRMLKCESCTVGFHRDMPLHRVERWNSQHFEKDSLQNLGHRYQLGHYGGQCPCPMTGPKNFIVFDLTGTHSISIDYCDCGKQPLSPWTQLLREQWFPATLARPQTVFTFQCLETFHELTLQGKTSLYDYYHTLLRRSDNAGIQTPINRYSEIHRVFRMWRNLMALKRAGRGHVPDGISTTSNGELMVECPACPHPGRNLPTGWEQAGPLLFLYTLFIAVDGNFKLKGKDRVKVKDIELMPAWGAYVPQEEYKEHIANYVGQPEISSCDSQHDALVRAATRLSPGYSVSGVVVVICSRHCLVRKNGAGDLQKGEKYCNVDFVIFSSLVGIALLRLVLTYDIVCEWAKNFRKRLDDFPPEMHIPSSTQVDVAVPGWHINGHGDKCRENFNLSYMEGAGRTVGEDVETIWSGTNPLAPSVREMGPSARHDTLNDHWNGWNFRKIVGFRILLWKRLAEALKMSAKQTAVFSQLSATFSPDTIAKWELMVTTWNINRKAPNPYKEPKSKITLNDVRLELSQEEAADAARGVFTKHKLSPTAFLMLGFDIENSQYVLRTEAAKLKGLKTSKQLADLQDKRNALLRQINNWREVQLVYTPHVASLLSVAPDSVNEDSSAASDTRPIHSSLAENIPLYMPSSLPPHIRSLPELSSICKLEQRLREPMADDALAEIRRHRRVIQGLWQFKRLNASGTGNKPNTKMVTMYKRFASKTKRAAYRYRTARQALCVLDPDGKWSERLKQLLDTDINGPGRDLDDTSNSRFEPSWIWLVPRVTEEDGVVEEEFNESMRVEWAKVRARSCRWEEEVLLVQEEMRRVLEYHKWKSDWWLAHAVLRSHEDPTILSGILGYAHKQADICRRLAIQCAGHWLPRLRKKGIIPSWAAEYENALPAHSEKTTDPVSKSSHSDVHNTRTLEVESPDDDLDFSEESDEEENVDDDAGGFDFDLDF